LDAIYKSMEEHGDGAAEANKKREEEALHYSQCYNKASLAGSYRASSRPYAAATTTSSSSDCSSYGGFFFLQGQVVAAPLPAPRPHHRRLVKSPRSNRNERTIDAESFREEACAGIKL
jgi:hypothetical protein